MAFILYLEIFLSFCKQCDQILIRNLPTPTDKPDCRKCAKALQELENIDDEADQLGIGFVKIHDEDLANEYNLGSLPALVYYRHQTPIIYEGISSNSFGFG